jgi:hypothetical protein
MKSFFSNFKLRKGYDRVLARVDIDIDVETLMRDLGEKALLNKSKRSRAFNGAVVVTVKEL